MLVWKKKTLYIQLDPIGSHHIPFNPIKKSTLWLFNIAIEHDPFSLILTIKNDDEVFKHGDFPVRYILRIPSEIPCNPAKSMKISWFWRFNPRVLPVSWAFPPARIRAAPPRHSWRRWPPGPFRDRVLGVFFGGVLLRCFMVHYGFIFTRWCPIVS